MRRTRNSTIGALLTVSLTACVGNAADDSQPSSSTESDFAATPLCQNFNLHSLIASSHSNAPRYQCEVSSGLSRSSQPDESWIRSLSNPQIRQHPFRSVVNLRGEHGANGEAASVVRYGMTARQIKVTDMRAPTRSQVLEFLSFATNPDNQPVLVHCFAGQGRTGTFVAAYRMAVQGWSSSDAIAEARSFNVNDDQASFLADFATHLNDSDVRNFLHAPGSH